MTKKISLKQFTNRIPVQNRNNYLENNIINNYRSPAISFIGRQTSPKINFSYGTNKSSNQTYLYSDQRSNYFVNNCVIRPQANYIFVNNPSSMKNIG